MAHIRAWKSSQPSCRTYMTVFSPFLDSDERPRCEWRIQLPWYSRPTSGCSCCTLNLHIQRETTHYVLETHRALRLQLCLRVHLLGPWLPFQPPASACVFRAPLGQRTLCHTTLNPDPSCPQSFLKTESKGIWRTI